MMISQEHRSYCNYVDMMLSKSDQMMSIASPVIEAMALNSCSYYLIYPSGETFNLGSDASFLTKVISYFAETSNRISILDYISKISYEGKFIVSTEPNIQQHRSEFVKNLSKEYDYEHELICVEKIDTKKGKAIQVITYTSPKNSNSLNRFTINHPEQIDRMNRYLSSEIANAFSKTRLQTPNSREQTLAMGCFNRICQTSINKVFNLDPSATILRSYKKQPWHKVHITPRELQVVYWYMRGMSIDSTANIMHISSGSVRTYFDRLKTKLDCQHKHHIPLKLVQEGFIDLKYWITLI